MPLICRQNEVIGDPPIAYTGYGVVHTEIDHWYKLGDYRNFDHTPLVMHFINPDQCVIVLRSTLQEVTQYNVLPIDNNADRLNKEWNKLAWQTLREQCPPLHEVEQQEPRWHVWLQQPMYVVDSALSIDG